MTRRRFFASPDAIVDGRATLSADETQHLRNVLRLNMGDEVYVFDGAGCEFRGEIEAIGRDGARIQLAEEVAPAAAESGLNLTMAVALLKGEKFDLALQKLTELGVTGVVPIITTRADVRIRNDDDADRKLIRWRRIVMEATKQCGRARLLTVARPVTFDQFIVSSPVERAARLMFSERGGALFRDAHFAKGCNRITTLGGSEGGWTDEEITQARDAGWQVITMGGRIMRAETAAIVCAALLQHRLGDLN
jgi:16S rRNA (uracil1498-N3)-methyltransferase